MRAQINSAERHEHNEGRSSRDGRAALADVGSSADQVRGDDTIENCRRHRMAAGKTVIGEDHYQIIKVRAGPMENKLQGAIQQHPAEDGRRRNC